jgi:hypothetical protein
METAQPTATSFGIVTTTWSHRGTAVQNARVEPSDVDLHRNFGEIIVRFGNNHDNDSRPASHPGRQAGVDTAYRLDTIEQKDGKIHRLGMMNFKSRAVAGQNFGLEFKPDEGFSGFTISGKDSGNVQALLKAIIEESIELNGMMLKRLAHERHGISETRL